VTARLAGAVGNVATTEEMANASFGAATLTGGVDALLGEIRISVTDASAESIKLRFGGPTIGGMSLDYHSMTFPITHASA